MPDQLKDFLALDKSQRAELIFLYIDNTRFGYKSCLSQLSTTRAHFWEKSPWSTFVQALSQCRSLTTLTLQGNMLNKLTSNQWITLGGALAQCRALTTLNIVGTPLGDFQPVEWKAFCDVLTQCQALTTLCLANNQLGDKPPQWKILGVALARCHVLTYLDLSSNNLGEQTPTQWESLCVSLADCHGLSSLHLGRNHLEKFESEQWAILGKMFSSIHSPFSLDLRVNALNKVSWLSLGSALALCRTLSSLDLSGNDIGELSSVASQDFCQAMLKCRALSILDLSSNHLNKLKPAQWQFLGDSLIQCQSLTSLSLGYNDFHRFTPDHWLVLEGVLTKSYITSLSISGNSLAQCTTNEWQLFCSILTRCHALTSLDLSGNEFNTLAISNWQILGIALEQCFMLTFLDLGYNYHDEFSSTQWQALGMVLSQCRALTSLSFSGGHAYARKPSQWQDLGSALVQCPSLTTLKLSGLYKDKMSQKVLRDSIKILAQCKTLLKIETNDYLSPEYKAEIEAILASDLREATDNSVLITPSFATKIPSSLSATKTKTVSFGEALTASSWDVEQRPLVTKASMAERASASTMSTSSPKIITQSLMQEKSVENVVANSPIKSNTPPPAISHTEYVAMTSCLQSIKASPKSFEKDLAEELQVLKQQIQTMSLQAHTGFTAEETQRLQASIIADKTKEALLTERQVILKNADQRAYYEALQTYISELMVASLGVGSGYVPVNKSKGAQAVGWVCTAISSVFPGASIATSAVNSGVSYLDVQYRKFFLEKVRVLGTTLMDAEVLGEQVARLLVRAHYHAGLQLSSKKAGDDAEKLIKAIVEVEKPILRNEETGDIFVKMIFGYMPCIDPLPSQTARIPTSQTVQMFQQDESTVFVGTHSPSTEDMNITMQKLMSQLAEERVLREEAQRAHQQELNQLRTQVQSKASKVDVDKLKGSTSEGGQILCLEQRNHDDAATAIAHVKSERQQAYLDLHVEHVITPEILELKEKDSQKEARIAELEKALIAAKLLPTQNIFSQATSAQKINISHSNNSSAQQLTPTDEESLKRGKCTIS